MRCPTKGCKNHRKGMTDLARLSKEECNWWCWGCGCHYYGPRKRPRFFNKEQWDRYVNEEG